VAQSGECATGIQERVQAGIRGCPADGSVVIQIPTAAGAPFDVHSLNNEAARRGPVESVVKMNVPTDLVSVLADGDVGGSVSWIFLSMELLDSGEPFTVGIRIDLDRCDLGSTSRWL